MKNINLFRLSFVFAALSLGTVAVHAQDVGPAKARIEQRLGSVIALKDRGAAGENNRGLLEARGGASGQDQQVIAAENADRAAIYAALAAQTGTSADAVGRRRAQQLAELAKPGHWIQDASGAWRQK
ncbi:MAG: DUF1318 domain-containing protein [Opitutaceae bacterium]